MRTTLTIDDDVLEAAKSLARTENRTVGAVLSELARRGLKPQPQQASLAGFPIFQVSENAQAITSEMVAQAQEEG